ncbi:hypothetical protein [Paenibacillus sp. sgz5001063]|uniref:hypothetical protein n=1 Tax=Paenibacillus sp. sgz5001063 TaxID=3242474 RepID=UPI0036D267A2
MSKRQMLHGFTRIYNSVALDEVIRKRLSYFCTLLHNPELSPLLCHGQQLRLPVS